MDFIIIKLLKIIYIKLMHTLFLLKENNLSILWRIIEVTNRKVYIQCSLPRITSSWILWLHESYEIDWSAFGSASKKTIFPHETASNAQVEAQALYKNETGNINHCSLKVQQSNENGRCDKSAATINLKFIGNYSRRLMKNWKLLLTDGKSMPQKQFFVKIESIFFLSGKVFVKFRRLVLSIFSKQVFENGYTSNGKIMKCGTSYNH